MKKIILMAVSAVFAFTSCDSFLDSENYTQANTGNFPAAPSDLNSELAALYGVMNQYANDPLQTPWFVPNIMSDDLNGGGGTGDVESHAISHLMSNKDALYSTAWHCTYVGIARANAIIASVDAFDWTGKEDKRNQLLGEAYFMRGLFYLWGSQFWGDIPAYWAAAAPDPCPQVSAEEVIYPHILADFVSATNLMKHGATTQGDGHATKGAAEGYLARAYMFYQGFYKKAGELATANLADVELPEQEGVEGALTKAQVVSYLEDAINNGGYSLVEDFRLLWQYTNELSAPDYPFVKDLVDEGTALHHCVGQYVKKVAQNKCVILFVRKVSEPDKSLCTIEVRDGQVVQARCFGNQEPPAPITAFIEQWKRRVLYAADEAA